VSEVPRAVLTGQKCATVAAVPLGELVSVCYVTTLPVANIISRRW
jgi:hypothetical protein